MIGRSVAWCYSLRGNGWAGCGIRDRRGAFRTGQEFFGGTPDVELDVNFIKLEVIIGFKICHGFEPALRSLGRARGGTCVLLVNLVLQGLYMGPIEQVGGLLMKGRVLVVCLVEQSG